MVVPNQLAADLKALTFDVFGTVVDWRGTIAREGLAVDSNVDWAAIADEWRGLYRPTIDQVTRGERAWSPFDHLQRVMLDQVLDRRNLTYIGDQQRAGLAGLWARLDAWPDAVPGLAQLKSCFVVCALSNGSVRQLVSIAKRAGLPWDLVLSVEMFQAYKPDPRVYQGAIGLLQCQPGEVLMVAAHPYDLRAARAAGMRTAHVSRPLEWGPQTPAEPYEPGEFDLFARDIEDLAQQLCPTP